MTNRPYQICTRCIMDTSDPHITFDEQGVCNHCRDYEKKWKKITSESHRRGLEKIIERIKEEGRNKEHDCVIGVSGGVDSSYLAYLAVKKFGLRPLAVHLDNGWNSELAVKNIENLIKKLGIDLYTYVIDWEEFKDLQRSFIKASVVDIELLTDNAIVAILYQMASKERLKFILTGGNIATEAIMPLAWNHRKSDVKNIRSIQKIFGTQPIKTFPSVSTIQIIFYELIKRIKAVRILNYLPYEKKEAMRVLEEELHWRPYQSKHGESLFTKFYQNYILPTKFGIDKRRAHLSTLICSHQMTREDALREIQKELYSPQALAEDKEYVLKKMGFTAPEFEQIMKTPPRSHFDYPYDRLRIFIKSVFKI
ncbi:MAG: N-acetyl sugar amidotransferase [Candidatus Omnitrophica bacterium]|nr:N-acetyl sugar amidotransferase [Candidatus Omnitrophota bacterium]